MIVLYDGAKEARIGVGGAQGADCKDNKMLPSFDKSILCLDDVCHLGGDWGREIL